MKACCFTGHRRIAKKELPVLRKNLKTKIYKLIDEGVETFYSGGAIGFDMLAGFTVIQAKKEYSHIKLIMALPCPNQDKLWKEREQRTYRQLLRAADEINFVSDACYMGCMKKRNHFMVENSDFCIAYLRYGKSGTAQTVRMAKKKGIKVFTL